MTNPTAPTRLHELFGLPNLSGYRLKHVHYLVVPAQYDKLNPPLEHETPADIGRHYLMLTETGQIIYSVSAEALELLRTKFTVSHGLFRESFPAFVSTVGDHFFRICISGTEIANTQVERLFADTELAVENPNETFMVGNEFTLLKQKFNRVLAQ